MNAEMFVKLYRDARETLKGEIFLITIYDNAKKCKELGYLNIYLRAC